MPGQFINRTNSGGLKLVNNNDSGNIAFVKEPQPPYNIYVYAKNQSAPSGAGFDIQFFIIPIFGWMIVGSGSNVTSTSCAQYGWLSGTDNRTDFDFRIVRTGTSQTILFDRDYSTTCPSIATLYCAEVVTLAPTVNIAFTVQVVGGDYVNC